jgi:hypothetical protein
MKVRTVMETVYQANGKTAVFELPLIVYLILQDTSAFRPYRETLIAAASLYFLHSAYNGRFP